LALVALPKCDAATSRQPHELLARHLEQATVGGIRHGFLLHRGVDDHTRKIGRLERIQILGCGDALRQQLFHPGFTQALAKARQRRGIAGKASLEEHFAAEELPVGVFQPALAEGFVRQIVGVLQVEQPTHQSQRQRRTAAALGLGWQHRRQTLGHDVPGHHRRKLAQRMPQIDLRIQAIATQVGRHRRGALSGSGLMPHAKTLVEIARNPSADIIFPAISTGYFLAYLAVQE
jgi:hypothetical protein